MDFLLIKDNITNSFVNTNDTTYKTLASTNLKNLTATEKAIAEERINVNKAEDIREVNKLSV